jgi:hypothetical protein
MVFYDTFVYICIDFGDPIIKKGKKQPTLTASICKFLVPSNTITFVAAI